MIASLRVLYHFNDCYRRLYQMVARDFQHVFHELWCCCSLFSSTTWMTLLIIGLRPPTHSTFSLAKHSTLLESGSCCTLFLIDKENILRRFFELPIWESLSKLCSGPYLAPLWCYFLTFGSHHSRHISVRMTDLFFKGSKCFSLAFSCRFDVEWAALE